MAPAAYPCFSASAAAGAIAGEPDLPYGRVVAANGCVAGSLPSAAPTLSAAPPPTVTGRGLSKYFSAWWSPAHDKARWRQRLIHTSPQALPLAPSLGTPGLATR